MQCRKWYSWAPLVPHLQPLKNLFSKKHFEMRCLLQTLEMFLRGSPYIRLAILPCCRLDQPIEQVQSFRMVWDSLTRYVGWYTIICCNVSWMNVGSMACHTHLSNIEWPGAFACFCLRACCQCSLGLDYSKVHKASITSCHLAGGSRGTWTGSINNLADPPRQELFPKSGQKFYPVCWCVVLSKDCAFCCLNQLCVPITLEGFATFNLPNFLVVFIF